MEMSQYTDLFLAEAKEHLDSLNENLLVLEKETGNIEILHEIFRSAHTLKGMAAAMGFEGITELTHEMESALMLLKEGKVAVTPNVVDILFRCLDILEMMIVNIGGEGEQNYNYQPLIEELRSLDKKKTNQDQTVIQQNEVQQKEDKEGKSLEFNEFEISVMHAAAKSRYSSFYIKIGLASGTVMKSVRAFMVFRALEEYGQIIKCNPPAQDLEEEKFDNSFEVVFITQESPEKILKSLEQISEVSVLSLQQIDTEWLGGNDVNREEAINHENAVIPKKTASQTTSERDLSGGMLRTVRVDIERLDNLMNLVGELVINKTRLEQIGLVNRIPDLLEAIEQMGRLTNDLQNVVMKVRMVPIKQVFNRFPRMVRDLARELNKEVRFIMEGQDTELDRTVIDEIGDPLVHLIRNALDHGIEHPEERIKAGKEKTALLRLAARQDGNNVIIEVEDDGRGIDIEKIRKKAREKGLLTEKEDEYADEGEVLKLIFQPGFSTAEVVTDLSGRGVGMDVVKSKIESLNGNISIKTKKNVGTKVSISLPLTLAIIQALLVSVGGEQYAIPLSSIDETTFVLPGQIRTVKNQEVMLLRGIVLPLLRLDRLLDVVSEERNYEELFVVVVRKGERRFGLVVDQLVGQQEIVIKSLGQLLNGIRGIAGATILGNGQVSLILDVNSLVL